MAVIWYARKEGKAHRNKGLGAIVTLVLSKGLSFSFYRPQEVKQAS